MIKYFYIFIKYIFFFVIIWGNGKKPEIMAVENGSFFWWKPLINANAVEILQTKSSNYD